MMLRLWAEIAYLWVEHDIYATGRYMTRANRRANPAPDTTTRFYVMSLRLLRFTSVHGRARGKSTWKDAMSQWGMGEVGGKGVVRRILHTLPTDRQQFRRAVILHTTPFQYLPRLISNVSLQNRYDLPIWAREESFGYLTQH
jgi:hypothetical protein